MSKSEPNVISMLNKFEVEFDLTSHEVMTHKNPECIRVDIGKIISKVAIKIKIMWVFFNQKKETTVFYHSIISIALQFYCRCGIF